MILAKRYPPHQEAAGRPLYLPVVDSSIEASRASSGYTGGKVVSAEFNQNASVTYHSLASEVSVHLLVHCRFSNKFCEACHKSIV